MGCSLIQYWRSTKVGFLYLRCFVAVADWLSFTRAANPTHFNHMNSLCVDGIIDGRGARSVEVT